MVKNYTFPQKSILCMKPPAWSNGLNILTHWGQVTHICVSKLTIIGSDNCLSPGWRQAIIWINDGILINGPLGTNFCEIYIITFSFKKIRLKVSSVKRRPIYLSLNMLNRNLQPVNILSRADINLDQRWDAINTSWKWHIWKNRLQRDVDKQERRLTTKDKQLPRREYFVTNICNSCCPSRSIVVQSFVSLQSPYA